MNKAVTIGTFDGVHRGHHLVLETLKKESASRGLQPHAITFDRHPLELIDPNRAPGNLMSVPRKIELIKAQGVTPILLPFTERLRSMTVYEWLRHIHRNYNVRLLVVGYDNTFGSDGLSHSIADYKDIGESVGVEIVCAPEVDGVSSSAIRKAVKAGDIAAAREMLGHLPELEGRVEAGFHLGASLGFPTANLLVPTHAVVPARGVYAALAFVGDENPYPAMVNVGNRPTFDKTSMASAGISTEAHIIGIDRNLYGKNVRLEFLERMRDEKKFDTVTDLIAQLVADREAAIAACSDYVADV